MLNNLSSNTGEKNSLLNVKTKCLQDQIDELSNKIDNLSDEVDSNTDDIEAINTSTSITKQTGTINSLSSKLIETDQLNTKQIRGCPKIDQICSNIISTGVLVTDCIPITKTDTVEANNVHTANLTAENAIIDRLVINCPVEIESINNNLNVTGDIFASNGVSATAVNAESYMYTNLLCSCLVSTGAADIKGDLNARSITTTYINSNDENVGKLTAGSVVTSTITANGSLINNSDEAYLTVEPFTGSLLLQSDKYKAVINSTGTTYNIQYSQEELSNINDITLTEDYKLVLHIEDPSTICYSSNTIAPVNFNISPLHTYNDTDYTIDTCGASWNEHTVILNRNCYGSGLCVKGLLKADRLAGEAMEVPSLTTCNLTAYNSATLTQDNELGDLHVSSLVKPDGSCSTGNTVLEGELAVKGRANFNEDLSVEKTITTNTLKVQDSGDIPTLTSNDTTINTLKASDTTTTTLTASSTTTDSLKVNETITSKNINNSGELTVNGKATLKETTADNLTVTNKTKTSLLEVGDSVTISDGLIATDNEIHSPDVHTCNIKPYSDSNSTLSVGHTNVSVNNLTVSGNLIQTGSSYNTHAEDLYVKNSCIKLRDCTNVGMSNSDNAGLTVLKYNGTDNMNLFVDCTGVARLGKATSLQPLALRNEEANMADGKIVEWDAANKRINTANCSVSELNTKINNCYNCNANKITALCGNDIAYKNKANNFNCLQTFNASLIAQANGKNADIKVCRTDGWNVNLSAADCTVGIYNATCSRWVIKDNKNGVYIGEKPALCVLSFDSSTGTLCLG